MNADDVQRSFKEKIQEFRFKSSRIIDDFTSANVKKKTDENFMATENLPLDAETCRHVEILMSYLGVVES